MRAGYGIACITPPLAVPCALGLEDELVAVLDDIYARAVWIDAGGEAVLIAAAEVIGFDPDDSDQLRSQIAAAVGLQASNVILHAVHNHSTASAHWETSRLLQPWGLADQLCSPRFMAILRDGLMRAAEAAAASAAPCRLAYAEAPVAGIASNRRVPLSGGPGRVVFRSSRPAADLRAAPEGPIDPLVRLLLFRLEGSGELIGITNYNCHPTVAGGDEGPYISGDYPSMGMRLAEAELEGLHLLHLTGTCGEINPGKHVSSDGYTPGERQRDVLRLGRRYALGILAAIGAAGLAWVDAPALSLQLQDPLLLQVAPALPGQQQLAEQLAQELAVYRVAKPAGAQQRGPGRRVLGQMMVRRHTHDGHVAAQAAALQVGEVTLTFIPGEIFLQFGDALRKRLGRPKLLNTAYCFGSNFGYVVPAEAFAQGGYEPTATALAPDAYDALLDDLERLCRAVRGDLS